MDLGIKGKTAFVTGAGRGLGMGICKSLAREGVKIIALSRTQSDLNALMVELGGAQAGHSSIELDLARPGAALESVSRVQEILCGGFPEIVINNVGGNLGYTNPLGPVSEWREVMHLNVEVAVEINQHFIPPMQAAGWGRVCHVSSISALENQGPPSYCAAKAALNSYVRSMGRFVSADNVILTSVMPGAVFTPGGYWDTASKERPEHVKRYLDERMAIKRFGTIEEISEVVSFLCSQHASFCVGSCMLVDGGQGRVFYPSDF